MCICILFHSLRGINFIHDVCKVVFIEINSQKSVSYHSVAHNVRRNVLRNRNLFFSKKFKWVNLTWKFVWCLIKKWLIFQLNYERKDLNHSNKGSSKVVSILIISIYCRRTNKKINYLIRLYAYHWSNEAQSSSIYISTFESHTFLASKPPCIWCSFIGYKW